MIRKISISFHRVLSINNEKLLIFFSSQFIYNYPKCFQKKISFSYIQILDCVLGKNRQHCLLSHITLHIYICIHAIITKWGF